MDYPKSEPHCHLLLLDKHWIITAAHCIRQNGYTARDAIAVVGLHDRHNYRVDGAAL